MPGQGKLYFEKVANSKYDGYVVQAQRPLQPTVFIGLGGTGMKVLARFRRRLYDRYGDADFWRIYRWLAVDTDKEGISHGGVEQQKGMPIPDTDCIYTGLDTMAMNKILRNMAGTYSHLGDWFQQDVVDLAAWSFDKGAGQNRSAGRLLFVNRVREIRDQIAERIAEVTSTEALAHARKHGAQPAATLGTSGQTRPEVADVVIIGSLAGGTGSGCFMDCAYLVRAMQDRGVSINDVRGMFLLPDVFLEDVETDQEKENIRANGYAALRELEFYNGLSSKPFSTRPWGDLGYEDVRGQPYSVCYLFSKSNGRALKDAGEVYDLLADALAFATGGGELASRIRSCWSNAQGTVYNHGLVYDLPAGANGELRRAALGGDDADSGGNGRDEMLLYRRQWSIRFSSIGTASVTMKLPELRRLAAVRQVRRWLEFEAASLSGEAEAQQSALRAQVATAESSARARAAAVGGADAEARALAQTTQDAGLFLGPRNFLGRLQENATDRIDKTAKSKNAQAAETQTYALLRLLNSIAVGVEAPSAPASQDAATMISTTRGEAARDVQAARKTWGSDDLAQLASRLSRAAAAVRQGLPPGKPEPGAASANLQLDSVALTQWKDLDAHETGGFIDLLFGGLDDRARKLIRSMYRTWLTEECDKYVKRISAGLRRHFLVQVAADLDALARQARDELDKLKHTVEGETDQIERAKQSQLAELDPWGQILRKLQNDLAMQFEDSRHYVVSSDIAAKAEKEDWQKEAKLDAELDAVLDSRRFGGPFKNSTDRFVATRKVAIDGMIHAAELPTAATTLLELKRDTDRRMGKQAVERLVDVVALDILAEFPKIRDLFDSLSARGITDLTQSVLPNAMDRAVAYWRLNPHIQEYMRKVQPSYLCGTVLSPVSSYDREQAMKFLKDKNWTFAAIDPSERGAEGELVLVHEAHGFALQSLLLLPEWRKSYDNMCRSGRGAARHLDNRLVSQLPDLVGVEDEAAIEETRSWDLALLGILTGRLKWAKEWSTYRYNPTRQQPVDVGLAYETVAWWLRNNGNYRKQLEGEIDRWFEDRAELPDKLDPEQRAEAALREARRLAMLGLVLRVLGERCYRRPRAMPGMPIPVSPPEHTMTVRLRSEKVERYLDILKKNHPEIDREKIEDELASSLQKYVRFVGPSGEGNGSVLPPGVNARACRILQLLPEGKENEDGGKSVLLEAYKLGWYKDEKAQVSGDVTSFFPNWGQHRDED